MTAIQVESKFKPVVFGMAGPKGVGMALTELESKRLKQEKLRAGCQMTSSGQYRALYRKKPYGVYDTIKECNQAYDKAQVAHFKKLRLKNKGYTSEKMVDGTWRHYASIRIGGENYYLGAHKDEKDAANLYIEAVNAMDNGDFEEWYKQNKPS